MKNEMKLEFDAISVNEGFARIAVEAFITPLKATLEELADIKTPVSEAVTNAIIHGYENLHGYGKHGDRQPSYIQQKPGKVFIRCCLEDDLLLIEVKDKGKGMEDIDKAMEPLFTTKPEYNRSGMGFAFMESFMDDLEVISEPGKGTVVRMIKKISAGAWIAACQV